MDEPLFGGTSRRDKAIELIIGGVGLFFICLTVLFSLIHGFGKSIIHLFFGLGIVALTLCELQLVRWYRMGDLEPKFKYMIASLGVSLLYISIIANVYFWAPAGP
ncbi:hypothetical protein H4R33_004778 [Dimargaris cristalligena]|uniref:Uncharacterized protein n=1 Tax=Dimargaris cristalligena TaxID=215637 RepID=A0A4P9ZWL3_9FUNG|nr:hypothetical protein H4R33_004778 [Dimargaris cristalligena]RKP38003.1 hypothetical protein BJ085DRAFT_36065 [Dimargaris cristalligena]|eukprot:RKP38003.1 hypothetical protein BJ085DRAFT_36065 [Dimargaris cristalligena]